MISHRAASEAFQLFAANLHERKIRGDVRAIEQYEEEIDSTLRDAGFDDIHFEYTDAHITVLATDTWDNGRKTSFIFDRP